jgi:hypothetical protein
VMLAKLERMNGKATVSVATKGPVFPMNWQDEEVWGTTGSKDKGDVRKIYEDQQK